MCDYCDFHAVDDTQELPAMPLNFDVDSMRGMGYKKTNSGVWLDYWDDPMGESFSTLVDYCCICGRKF